MSFSSSLRTFAAQASRERASAFSGETTTQGYNLQIGARKFVAAFTGPRDRRILEEQGISEIADALTFIPDSLSITLELEGEVTHLPTGDLFHIVEITPVIGGAEKRVLLRKLQNAS